MNANGVARHYGSLTAEERFRLILAASARGDTAERNRLSSAGQRIALSVSDHAPYALAFEQVALLTFMELTEHAALYSDARTYADEAQEVFGEADDEEELDEEAGEGEDSGDPESEVEEEMASEDGRTSPLVERAYDLALAAGFILRTKAEGWKLFCERMDLPPFLVWQELPGFDRLQRSLFLAENVAFGPQEFLRLMNEVRPAGRPELTRPPLSVEGMADATAKLFRDRVEWWGG